ARLTHVMSNSFGFGGNHGVLIFSRPDADPATSGPRKVQVVVNGLGVIGPGAVAAREITAPLPPGRGLVHSCGTLDVSLLNPNQRRRLSRLQQMALVAARRSHAPDESRRVTVAIGTGLGCLEDAGAFIENLISKDEREPMPSRFPNSVHNAPAGQVAIDQNARGMNCAPTVGEITFESSLWQGLSQLATDNADDALVGAVDELDKYLLGIGQRWGVWNDQVKPGEGAMVASLSTAEAGRSPLARLTALRLGRWRRPFDAGHEAAWIASAVDLKTIDIVLSGARGFPQLDPLYEGIAAALSGHAGKALEHRTYKRQCGEFHAASAFGFSQAVELAREKRCGVLLLTLSLRGGKAVCCVTP
ncbi:MAG TPA: beta-ketoacyl synthase chain length factor, partial [Verrucomicrobiae bacterium]|nr:beta-ketoacyl synthase chain length factor [Verrucomicrobiae bacterium]